jgi:hypothetical protein
MANVSAQVFVAAVRKMEKKIATGEVVDTKENPNAAELLAQELGLKNSSQVHTRIKSYTAKGVKLPTFAQKPRGRQLNVDALNAIGAEVSAEENGEESAAA